jgi:hypothetical protein
VALPVNGHQALRQPEQPFAVKLGIGEEPPQILGRQKCDLLAATLSSPAEGEAVAKAFLDAARQELKERQLVVRLNWEAAVWRLHEVAWGHAADLIRKSGLELSGYVLNDRVRECDIELAVCEGKTGAVTLEDGHVLGPEPFACYGMEVKGDDWIHAVEALKGAPTASTHVEDAVFWSQVAERHEEFVPAPTPSTDGGASSRPATQGTEGIAHSENCTRERASL